MSLLQYTTVVINKDPKLDFVIFEYECYSLATKTHNIIRNVKKRKREYSACMRPYPIRCASKGDYKNLMREPAK